MHRKEKRGKTSLNRKNLMKKVKIEFQPIKCASFKINAHQKQEID